MSQMQCLHCCCDCVQGEPIDWDDVLAASMIAAGARASSATRGAGGLPGSWPKPGAEPYVDLVAKTQRDVLLKVRRLHLGTSRSQSVTALLAFVMCAAGCAVMSILVAAAHNVSHAA
jgi:hypothetical protein